MWGWGRGLRPYCVPGFLPDPGLHICLHQLLPVPLAGWYGRPEQMGTQGMGDTHLVPLQALTLPRQNPGSCSGLVVPGSGQAGALVPASAAQHLAGPGVKALWPPEPGCLHSHTW